MTSKYQAAVAPQREEAVDALRELVEALASAGIRLPSVGLDVPSFLTGCVLVELGRAHPDTVRELAVLVRRGVACGHH